MLVYSIQSKSPFLGRVLKALSFCAVLLFSTVCMSNQVKEADRTAKIKDRAEPSKDGELVTVGKWNFAVAVGIGARTNPLMNSDDIPIVFIPELSYYGERFFLDNSVIGFTFIDKGAHMLNLIGTIGYDQVYFSRWNIGNFDIESIFSAENPAEGSFDVITDGRDPSSGPVPDVGGGVQQSFSIRELSKRGTAGLAGLEYGLYLDPFNIQFQALHDVTDVHGGQELRVGVSKSFDFANDGIVLSGGFAWQSDELVNYYYGIDRKDTEIDDLQYEAKGGINQFIKLDWRKAISRKWTWQTTLHYKWLNSEITNSPIVEERNVVTVFSGGVYRF